MIDVLAQAEDLECLDDLHALCTLMQTIRECPCRRAFYLVKLIDHGSLDE